MSVDLPLPLTLVAVVLNGSVALLALWRKSVTRAGALAGFLVGSAMLAMAGVAVWGTLMLFFVSSSAMSRAGSRIKREIQHIHEKGHQRDALQVLANSSASGAASVLYFFSGEPAFAVAAVGGFAAANADTWSSELGVLSATPPRSIVTGHEVPPGTSGGVTRAGSIAAIGGSLLIAVWFSIWMMIAGQHYGALSRAPGILLIITTFAGLAGSFLDSYLGATVQALYRREDGSLTERRRSVGSRNTLVRGRRLVTNDAVNFACTWSGALIAGGLAALIG